MCGACGKNIILLDLACPIKIQSVISNTFFVAYCGVVINGQGPSAHGLFATPVVMVEGARKSRKARTMACKAQNKVDFNPNML